MPHTIPISSAERKRRMQAYRELPENEQQKAQVIWDHLHYFHILGGLDELDAAHIPTAEEKRHALLVYKTLQMVWFKRLPKADKQSFLIYIHDRIPTLALPIINETFDTSIQDLASRCEEISRPEWIRKNATKAKISIDSFPHPIT